ncbi:hypothetical protein ABOM_008424, partial [Aspergillus bombycis]
LDNRVSGRANPCTPIQHISSIPSTIHVRKNKPHGNESRTQGEATEGPVSLVPQVVHAYGAPTETSWISYVDGVGKAVRCPECGKEFMRKYVVTEPTHGRF